MPFLQEHFPHLVASYKARYANRAFLPVEYKRRISGLVKKLCQKYGIAARDGESRQTANSKNLAGQLNLFA